MMKLGSKIHDLGKALMTPISVIAAAGIFLGWPRRCRTRR